MVRLPFLLVTLVGTGCYRPPNLPTTPWEAPVLSSGEDSPWRICAPERDQLIQCVVDGDTFDTRACGTANGAERFRMLGIDAPETEKPGVEAGCFADNALRELNRVMTGRVLTLSFDRNCTDVRTRTLAYVWMDAQEAEFVLDPRVYSDLRADVGDTGDAEPRVMLNEYFLLAGFARRFDEDWVEPLRWEAELIAAERLAQSRRNGLWGTCSQ
jgi:endonuclease YncB( thermonuclease family)